MPPVSFEPTISAGQRPQTHALDRTATGTGNPTYNSIVSISHMVYKKTAAKRCKPYGIPNAHNYPVKQ